MLHKTIIAKLLPLFTVTTLNKLDSTVYGSVWLKQKDSMHAELKRYESGGTGA